MATEIDRVLASQRPEGAKILTLVVADRNEIAGACIEVILRACGHTVFARCRHQEDLLRCAEACHPDVVLLAENIVRQEAAITVSRLRARDCSVSIIFLLDERDAITAADLLDLDVEGVLLSATCARNIIDCLESARRGRKWVDPHLLRDLAKMNRPSQIARNLTPREAEIANLISRGMRNKQIARELDLSAGTVKMHLHHIYEKLQLDGRTQLALLTTRACADAVQSASPTGS